MQNKYKENEAGDVFNTFYINSNIDEEKVHDSEYLKGIEKLYHPNKKIRSEISYPKIQLHRITKVYDITAKRIYEKMYFDNTSRNL